MTEQNEASKLIEAIKGTRKEFLSTKNFQPQLLLSMVLVVCSLWLMSTGLDGKQIYKIVPLIRN